MKKILITGAFGQLGASLCEVLPNDSILATGRNIPSNEKYREERNKRDARTICFQENSARLKAITLLERMARPISWPTK